MKELYHIYMFDYKREEPITPTPDTYGYRWVYAFLHIYIITIKVNGMYYKKPYGEELDYVTDDWTIIEIRDVVTNKTVEKISGTVQAYFDNHVEYYVGNHITGEPVHFCLTIDDFIKSQYKVMRLHYDHIRQRTI